MSTPKPADPVIAKLDRMIARCLDDDAKARVTDAATHLRQAIDLIADTDTSPDVREAAVAMDTAATVLLRFLEAHTKGRPA